MAESHTDLSKVLSKLRDETFSKTFPIDGKVFLLSLSGGADSVFLFHFLNFLKKNHECGFRAVHFNHNSERLNLMEMKHFVESYAIYTVLT